jgi:hypothetical protein
MLFGTASHPGQLFGPTARFVVAGLHVLPRCFSEVRQLFSQGRTNIPPAGQAWFLVITAA